MDALRRSGDGAMREMPSHSKSFFREVSKVRVYRLIIVPPFSDAEWWQASTLEVLSGFPGPCHLSPPAAPPKDD